MLVSTYYSSLTHGHDLADNPSLGAELEDVLWGLNAWLEIHPSEAIFLSLKPDQLTTLDPNARWLIKELLDETANFWVDTPNNVCFACPLSPKITKALHFPVGDHTR
jgi:hypothetical protein